MAEKIRFACTCGKSVSAPAEFAGKKAKCPHCGQVLRIPPAQPGVEANELPLEPLAPRTAAAQLPPLAVPPSSPAADRTGAAGPLAPELQTSIWDEVAASDANPTTSTPCPSCGAPMSPQAVVCLGCGQKRSATVEAAPLPSLASGRSSLAQSARNKHIRTARVIMFFVGGVQLLFGGLLFAVSGSIAKEMVDAEVKKLVGQGMIIDHQKVDQVQQAQERAMKVVAGLLLGVGAIFTAFGFFVNRYPVPITLTSLILFVGLNVADAVMSPENVVRGWWLKLIFVIALFKAVQAAIASQRERNLAQAPALGG